MFGILSGAHVGTVQVSEVVFTAAGGWLKCKHIIHVVGPMWLEDEEDTCKNDIKRAVLNCLTLTNNRLGLRSIGLPAISTGMLGRP